MAVELLSTIQTPQNKVSGRAWNPPLSGDDQVATRIKTLPDGNQIYELAKIFEPMYDSSMLPHQKGMMGYGKMIEPHTHRGDVIVLGLRMTAFEEARHADLQHAFIMAAIILVLGSGTLFFIFVIQNYYLVDRTLKADQRLYPAGSG